MTIRVVSRTHRWARAHLFRIRLYFIRNAHLFLHVSRAWDQCMPHKLERADAIYLGLLGGRGDWGVIWLLIGYVNLLIGGVGATICIY